MIKADDFFVRIIRGLGKFGIPYMLTGSMGSSIHGIPRATNDIDLVIDADENKLDAFIQYMMETDQCYANPAHALEALRKQSMFNIIDNRSGGKADLIIRKNRSFSREEFDRRIEVIWQDVPIFVASPEDAILSKLEWAKKGESERQFRDALGVAACKWATLDLEYLHRWAKCLDIEDYLDRLVEIVREINKL